MTVAVSEPGPRLAPDVELIGPYRDSGLQDPPYLLRRAGRIIQVSRLLYVVAAAADGKRGLDEVAAVAGVELDRPLTAEHVEFLVEKKLAPAGILTIPGLPSAAPSTPIPAAESRLLGLRFRQALVPPEFMSRGAQLLSPLFRPAVVAGVLAAVAGLDIWLFGIHGTGAALEQTAGAPALLALVFALVLLSGAFHEFGHATGCRYSGGRPGAAGVGLYLIWPVMYSNVTDAYRLDRRGRLRTDLGGIYFNAVFIVALGCAYAASGWEPLLAVVVLEHVLVFHQFIPWIRLDGFYIVSDLTGVPDILSRVRPALSSLLPGRPMHPDFRALRPSARRLLVAYLVSLAVFLVVGVVPAVALLPRTLGASWTAIGPQLRALGVAAGQWDTIMVVARAAAVAVLALPAIGLALTLGVAAKRLGRIRRKDPHPLRQRLEATGLAIVEGGAVPGGGVVDYFGFGSGGEVVLFGSALDRPGHEVATGLVAAAESLGSFTSDDLDLVVLLPDRYVTLSPG